MAENIIFNIISLLIFCILFISALIINIINKKKVENRGIKHEVV